MLREASAYVSAAYNETYGRSLVEALRCGLPIVTQASCNMHVTHGVNGLLGDGVAELAANIAAVVKDDALRGRLARAARWLGGGAQAPRTGWAGACSLHSGRNRRISARPGPTAPRPAPAPATSLPPRSPRASRRTSPG